MLITLGIIGIVAAMTIPTLVNQYQERETITKLKKFNSTINQAFNLAVAEYGPPEGWDGVFTSGGGCGPCAVKLSNIFFKYMRRVANCDYGAMNVNEDNSVSYSDTLCFNEDDPNNILKRSAIQMNGAVSGHADIYASGNYSKNILPDGSYLAFQTLDAGTCTNPYGVLSTQKDGCGTFFYDVNGPKKKPNILGYDVFVFYLTSKGIYPAGSPNMTNTAMYNFDTCKLNSTGFGCAAWAIFNENMDYKKCNNLSWNGKKTCD